MPRGGGRGNKKSHKGQRRHFTTEEEMKAQAEKAEKEKEWRRERGIPSDEESDEEGAAAKKEGSDSEESSDESEGEAGKNKGVSHLIEVANPNYSGAATKTKKVTTLEEDTEGPQLSRREREELQKQQAAAHYRKMHLAGKTDEARSDMARLAIIRQQREEQAARKAAQAKVKDDVKKTAEQKLLDKKKASK